MKDYQDIIHRKRYVSADRPGMSIQDRAAQFSAFAALTGFDGVIRETGRLTDGRTEQDEGELLVINQTLCALMEQLHEQPQVTLTWFRPDERKSGGAYVTYTGCLKKIDTYHRLLCFTDGAQIPMDSLCQIQKSDL